MKELVKKLTEVMAAVEHIPKRGHNDFHNYDYPTEADVADAVRSELTKRNVLLIPAITGESRHSVGEKGSVLTVLEMEMEFYDADSGQSIKKPWRGYGTDKEDKGGYKAMTGGEKYFLLKTFLIPTGDDPEADGEHKSAQRQQPAARREVPNPQQSRRPAATTTKAGHMELFVVSAKIAKTGTNAKGPWALHVVKFSDGREGKTFSKSVYSAALEASKDHRGIDVTLNNKGDIVKMEPVFQQRSEPQEFTELEPPPF